jgi:hypothetical protein
MPIRCSVPRVLGRLIAVFAFMAATGAPAAAQAFRLRPKPPQRAAPSRVRPAPYAGGPRRSTLVTVAESEPNDSLTTADPVALGDTVTGTINPTGDVDYFVLTIPAGTWLDLDVDANQIGSPLDPVMALFTGDGSAMLAYSDDADGLDPHIRYSIATTGSYIVGIAGRSGGGTQYTYRLKIGTVTLGPGDPTTLVAGGLGYPYALAADGSGNLFTVDMNTNYVHRIDRAGAVTTYAALGLGDTTPGYAEALVVDGFGDLLAAGADSAFNGGSIFRISAQGAAVSHFAHLGPDYVTALTIGPDGDVWAASGGWIRRFDPTGVRKDSLYVSVSVRDLRFSPSGALHFTNGYDAVMRVTGTRVDTVIRGAPYIETIAFDKDGYVYVANGYVGEIDLYDPTYQRVGDAFARSNLGGPLSIAFARAADGSMTSNLFAANAGYNLPAPYVGSIVELNPAAMRAAGFRIGIDLLRLATTELRAGVIGEDYADTVLMADPSAGQARWSVAAGALPAGLSLNAGSGIITGIPQAGGRFTVSFRGDVGTRFGIGTFTIAIAAPTVSVADAASHLLGAGVLTAARERYLDFVGNHNGRYDVGDFRAFLRAASLLPGVTAGAGQVNREAKP